MAAAFTVGLDQQVRCWRLRLNSHKNHELEQELQERGSNHLEVADLLEAACYHADSGSNGSSSGCSLEVAEAGCCFTQVVEPASLDVLQGPPPAEAFGSSAGSGGGGGGASRQYLLGVAGRGTEVLAWSLPLWPGACR